MATLEEQLGAMVRYHRIRAGLSQQELADRIGKTSVTVSRIETGKSATKFEGLSGLAAALEVDVRDLFGVGSFAAKEGRSDPLVGIVDQLAGLSDAELSLIAETLVSMLKFKDTK
ncbi:helix-turn-helix transcriptional regulator [Caulobacter sp.]|uniref:helix-turn-helix domain-containing protein n=1 Tax=Caulobacter sp. TaxID=78 RepID=UPI0031E00E0A